MLYSCHSSSMARRVPRKDDTPRSTRRCRFRGPYDMDLPQGKQGYFFRRIVIVYREAVTNISFMQSLYHAERGSYNVRAKHQVDFADSKRRAKRSCRITAAHQRRINKQSRTVRFNIEDDDEEPQEERRLVASPSESTICLHSKVFTC